MTVRDNYFITTPFIDIIFRTFRHIHVTLSAKLNLEPTYGFRLVPIFKDKIGTIYLHV